MALKVYCCITGNKHEIHRTRGRTAFSVVCHVPANIQATSAVVLSVTCGTAYDALMSLLFFGATQILKSSKSFENNGSKSQALGSFQSFLSSLEERLLTIYEVFKKTLGRLKQI